MKIIISGASSMVARYLLPLLNNDGHVLTGLSRREMPSSDQLNWVRVDFNALDPGNLAALKADALVHLAPLPVLAKLQPLVASAGIRQVIAVGTSSVITKAHSVHAADLTLVSQMRCAEQELSEFAEREGIAWSLLRPTMVYDGVHDRNIALIKRFIGRFGFAPVVSPASGKRQPLHAADLATVIVSALERKVSGKAYTIGGGEVLAYHEMLDRIFFMLGKPTRILRLPRAAIAFLLNVVSRVPAYRYLNPAMADRMNQDMFFDNSAARNELGFNPRCFEPGGKC